MTTHSNSHPHPTEPDMVNCETCLREIPADSKHTIEIDDYILHFCGIDCYEAWKNKKNPPTRQGS